MQLAGIAGGWYSGATLHVAVVGFYPRHDARLNLCPVRRINIIGNCHKFGYIVYLHFVICGTNYIY